MLEAIPINRPPATNYLVGGGEIELIPYILRKTFEAYEAVT